MEALFTLKIRNCYILLYIQNCNTHRNLTTKNLNMHTFWNFSKRTSTLLTFVYSGGTSKYLSSLFFFSEWSCVYGVMWLNDIALVLHISQSLLCKID